MRNEMEKSVKRWLKRKISISLATIVVFAISGSIGIQQSFANSVAVGKNGPVGTARKGNAIASGLDSVAVGDSSKAQGKRAIAVGVNSEAAGEQSIAIGGAKDSGNGAKADGDQAIAIGGDTHAKGASSIAIGGDDINGVANKDGVPWNKYNGQIHNGKIITNETFNNSDIAIKYKQRTGQYLVDNTNAATRYVKTTGEGAGTIAIGTQSFAGGALATALGTGSKAGGFAATSFGIGAKATKDNSVALGAGSITSLANASERNPDGSLKYEAITIVNPDGTTTSLTPTQAKAEDEKYYSAKHTPSAKVGKLDASGNFIPGQFIEYKGFAGGTTHMKKGDFVSVGSKDYERQIKHVAAGQINPESTDAINGSQLFSIADGLQDQIKKSTKTYFHYNDPSMTQGKGDINTNLGSITDKAGATGSHSVTAGVEATATQTGGIAIGHKASSTGIGAVVIGGDGTNLASGSYSLAVGNTTKASGAHSTAMGKLTTASGSYSTAMGINTLAKGVYSTAMGRGSHAKGVTSTAIGEGAEALGQYSTSIGVRTHSIGEGSIAMGRETKAGKAAAGVVGGTSYATAMGDHSYAEGQASTAMGFRTHAKGINSIAMGNYSKSIGDNSTAIGQSSTANGEDSLATQGGTAHTDNSIAIGDLTVAGQNGGSQKAVAIGYGAKATENKSLALGFGAEAKNENSVALGQGAMTRAFAQVNNATVGTGTGSIMYGGFAGIANGVVSVGNIGAEKQIINVAPGAITATSTDAINGSQLYSVADKLRITGLNFSGDTKDTSATANKFNRKLGEETKIVGGVTDTTKLTDGNLGVVSNGTDTLTVKLAKELKGLTSVETVDNAGNKTVQNADGITINNAGNTVSLTKDGLNNGGKKITNVAKGDVTATSTDAVNGSQLHSIKNQLTAAGLDFTGNNSGTTVHRELGSKLTIEGETGINALTNTSPTAADNIYVAADATNNKLVVKLAKDLKGIGSTQYINNGGNNTIKIDGNTKTITGLANTISLPTDPAVGVKPTGNMSGKVATVNDILNSGWNLQENGNKKDFVRPYDTVNFENGKGTTVNIVTDAANEKSTIKINVDGQALTNNAQLPVVYTKADGTKVYKQPDGTFNTAPDGSGTTVPASDIIASMQNAAGSTTNPSKLANVKSTVGHNNSQGPITQGDAKTATNNLLTKTGGLSTAATVGDLQAIAQAGLDFTGNNIGTTVHRPLATKLIIEGEIGANPLTNTSPTAADNIYVAADATNNKLVVKLAEDLKGLKSVVLGAATGNNVVSLTTAGINAGQKKITNVANGDVTANSKDAVNGSQLHSITNQLTTKGLDFTGNNSGTTVHRELGSKLTIEGETGTNALTNTSPTAADNIYVAADTTNNKLVVKLAKDLKGIGSTQYVDNGGNNTIKIDGNTKTITGLAGTLPDTQNSTSATVPNVVDNSKVATVGDVLNSGWNLQNNGTAKDFVKAYDTVDFVDGNGTTVVVNTDPNKKKSTIQVNVNGQALANSAQLPVVYTKADGTKVYKHTDGNFYTGLNGAGTQVQPADIIASMQNADGTTSNPSELANVKSTVGHNNSQGPITQGDAKTATNDLLTKGNGLSTAATVGDLQAIAQAGLNFKGDDGTVIHKPLGNQLDIIGGADKNKLSDNNIGVNSTADGKLKVQLAKELKSLTSVETVDNAGNKTVQNADGIIINNAGNTVSLTKDGLNNGGKKITNVADGEVSSTSKDAVNGAQLYEIKNSINNSGNAINNLNQKVDDVDDRLSRGIAGATAMAGLEFMEIGINQGTVAAAVGGYRGRHSVAVGMQVAPTVNTRVNAKAAVTPARKHTDVMYSVGASYRFNWK